MSIMKSEFHGDRLFMPRTKHFLGHTGPGILLVIFSAFTQRGPYSGALYLNLNGFRTGSDSMQDMRKKAMRCIVRKRTTRRKPSMSVVPSVRGIVGGLPGICFCRSNLVR